jgi:hypothetical protein
MKTSTKFHLDWSKGLEVIAILTFKKKKKWPPMAAILDFRKIKNTEIIVLMGMKTSTKFQLGRSKGSKVTAI